MSDERLEVLRIEINPHPSLNKEVIASVVFRDRARHDSNGTVMVEYRVRIDKNHPLLEALILHCQYDAKIRLLGDEPDQEISLEMSVPTTHPWTEPDEEIDKLEDIDLLNLG